MPINPSAFRVEQNPRICAFQRRGLGQRRCVYTVAPQYTAVVYLWRNGSAFMQPLLLVPIELAHLYENLTFDKCSLKKLEDRCCRILPRTFVMKRIGKVNGCFLRQWKFSWNLLSALNLCQVGKRRHKFSFSLLFGLS